MRKGVAAISVSILFITLSFPTVIGAWHFPDLGPLIWIAWVPFLLWMRECHYRGLARYAFIVCFGYYALSMYWLYFAMANFGGLSGPTSVAILLFLCLILALYGAAAFGISSLLARKARVPMLITLPILWTLAEWCRERFPLQGFPWSNFAYSLGHDPFAMQWAEFIGPSGISGVVMWVNLLIAKGIAPRKKIGHLIVAGIVLATVHSTGYWRYHTIERKLAKLQADTAPISVALIQGNIAQDEKWDPQEANRIRDTYRDLSLAAIESGAEVVVWPEAAYPYPIDKEVSTDAWFSRWARPGQHFLIGGLGRDGDKFYNSAFWIDENGTITDSVDKVHLVPLGEYVPYEEYLTFAKALTQAVGRTYPGEKGRPLQTPYGPWGVLICYEDLFPNLSRTLVHAGAQVLVNITNDAWYEHSSAPYQHLVYSQYRALESRRYLLRATNTGVTAVIDPLGRITRQLPWFEKEILKEKIWPIRHLE